MTKFNLPNEWLGQPLRIAVLGCGGTGYYIGTNLFMLQRILLTTCPEAAFERIDLYDGKAIAEPNLARTGYLPAEIGFNKAEVLANRLNMALGMESFKGHAHNVKAHTLYNYDIIITATDNEQSRTMVTNSTSRMTTLWLDTGVDKATASFVLGELSNSPDHLPHSNDLFPPTGEEQHEQTSCDMQTSLARQAFGINQQVAGQAINLLSQLLLDGSIHYHGGLIDLKSGNTSPILMDKQIWASLGYQPEAAQAA